MRKQQQQRRRRRRKRKRGRDRFIRRNIFSTYISLLGGFISGKEEDPKGEKKGGKNFGLYQTRDSFFFSFCTYRMRNVTFLQNFC